MNRQIRSEEHIALFIPGPTEVQPEVLDAQARWMIGHRMPECSDLIGAIEPKLQQVFMTEQPVLISASSGTGLMEAAIRNGVARKVLNCVNGAFSDRWRELTEGNGIANEVLEVAWGRPILPQMVAERLAGGGFDAVAITHNETSTGVTNPVHEIAQAVRALPGGNEILILVDSVSGMAGAHLDFDAWDLDVVLTASQKAFALPPGLAFAAVSPRALARAAEIAHRGYYFDFLLLEKYLRKNQTPATPAISLLYALDCQLDRILDEGMEARLERHLQMRDRTLAWAQARGFEAFAEAGYESPTVTCVANSRNIDVPDLNRTLRRKQMILSNGYGAQLKNKTFRIAHMGDTRPEQLAQLLEAIDGYLEA